MLLFSAKWVELQGFFYVKLNKADKERQVLHGLNNR